MQRRDLLALASLGSVSSLMGFSAQAQSSSTHHASESIANFPNKPIRLIVPFPPGGGTDILSRTVANKLTEHFRWIVVADNRSGAGGTVGITEAVKAAPTGYEMVIGQKDNLVLAPWLYKKLNYNALQDLIPVAHLAYSPVLICAPAQSRFKTFADVMKTIKEQPESITYASPGTGTSIHLSIELLNQAAQVKLRHIPYKGSSPAMVDVLSGQVDLLVSSVASAMSQIKAGKLRALAVTSLTRSSSLPDVPTIAESGYKDFDVTTWYGVFVPAKTPAAIVSMTNAKINQLLAMPEVITAIQSQGAEPKAMSNEEFAQLLNSDYQKWKSIVQNSGATLD